MFTVSDLDLFIHFAIPIPSYNSLLDVKYARIERHYIDDFKFSLTLNSITNTLFDTQFYTL